MQTQIIRSYFFSWLLISSVILGGVFGYLVPNYVSIIAPLGELFLNLIFAIIVPLVFFSVASAFAKINAWNKYRSLFFNMIFLFLLTGIIVAVLALITVKIFPLGHNLTINLGATIQTNQVNYLQKLVELVSVPSFMLLFSHKHMMALLIFAFLVGIASNGKEEHYQKFSQFLQAGETVFMRVFNLLMYSAPIGLFAYFAVLVHNIGATLLENYLRVTIVYYSLGIIVFVCLYTIYAYSVGKTATVKLFWRNIWLPATTALATCSSTATIPANLAATKAMKIHPNICDTVIPLGTLIHKEGSIIGGMMKIAFLFGLFNLNFSGPSVLLTAIGISLLVGTVMGAIPSGGMLGELLILSVYGFPPSALPIIFAISIIIDPIATVLNAAGNTINALLISKRVAKQFNCTDVA